MLLKGQYNGKGALYILVDEELLLLPKTATLIMNKLEDGKDIECAAYGEGLEMQYVLGLLEYLEKIGAGTFYDRQFYIEKVRSIDPLSPANIFAPKEELRRIHIFLTKECIMECPHCKGDRIWRSMPCEGCSKVVNIFEDSGSFELGLAEILIEDSVGVGCNRITIHAGCDQNNNELVEHLIRFSKSRGMEKIELVTGSGVHIGILNAINDVGGMVKFQLLSIEESGHDYLSGRKGCFEEIIKTLSNCQQLGNKYDILYLCDISERVDNIWNSLHLLGAQNVIIDRYWDASKALDDNALDHLCDCCIEACDVMSYIYMLDNSCMTGQLFACDDGYVYACPFIESTLLGRVEKDGIQKIISDRLFGEYWQASFYGHSYCRGCELRVACKACSAVIGGIIRGECQVANYLRG